MYDAQHLAAISPPPPVLLSHLPEPDCTVRSGPPVKKVKAEAGEEPKAKAAAEAPKTKANDQDSPAGTDKSAEASADKSDKKADAKDSPTTEAAEKSTMSAAAAERMVAKPGNDRDALKKELDCYRQAEQRARTRLQKLQASTTDAFEALDEAKRTPKVTGPVYRYRNDGPAQGRQGSILSFDQLRARGS
ncbi:MAG: hypothetical protein ACR2PO_00885 [Methyloligellaceae bacterium]